MLTGSKDSEELRNCRTLYFIQISMLKLLNSLAIVTFSFKLKLYFNNKTITIF